MTDNEIIKALECCTSEITREVNCTNCPMLGTRDCMTELKKNALDIINRQKEEIEKLQSDHSSMQSTLAKMSLVVEQAKQEAVKEFAERLQDKLATNVTVEYETNDGFLRDVYDITETHIAINELVKEMTEVDVCTTDPN